MQSSYYINLQNLSSDKNRADDFLTKIFNFNNQNQIKKLLKLIRPTFFGEDEIENYLQTMPHNLHFLIEKCYQIAVVLGQFKDFPENNELKDLHFLVFSVSQKSNQILEKNQVSVF